MTERTPYDQITKILEARMLELQAEAEDNGVFKKTWKKARVKLLVANGWTDDEFVKEMWRQRKLRR
jgi:hypothetical protein